MNLGIENQTILYIIIAILIFQVIATRYYVLNTIEQENRKNNKKLIKKLSKQINTTFDEYMGNSGTPNTMTQMNNIHNRPTNQNTIDDDSIDDPIDDIDE
jgi:hypothetical protein